jgi:Spy/CpxP family protein refolding chaperone
LVLSTLLVALSGNSDAGAAAPTTIETRAPAEPGARADREHAKQDLCAQLACTPTQRAQIDGVLAKMREQLKALHGSKDDRGQALADAMRDGSLDRNEVLGALGKNDEMRVKREGILADAIVGIYGALDKTQRARLTKIVEVRGTKAVLGGGHHGKHRGPDNAKGGNDKPAKGKQLNGERKAEHKAAKAARFARVRAPVAKVDGFKSRS